METTACPRCACKMSRVLETREITLRGHFIKMRIRVCRHCNKHFKTKEIVDQELQVHRSKKTNGKPKEPDPDPQQVEEAIQRIRETKEPPKIVDDTPEVVNPFLSQEEKKLPFRE